MIKVLQALLIACVVVEYVRSTPLSSSKTSTTQTTTPVSTTTIDYTSAMFELAMNTVTIPPQIDMSVLINSLQQEESLNTIVCPVSTNVENVKLNRLEKCITQKRSQQNESAKKRNARSVDKNSIEELFKSSFNLDEILIQYSKLKKLANELPVMVENAVKNLTETNTLFDNKKTNVISCKGDKVLQITKGVLINNNKYNLKCGISENERLPILNETCYETIKTTELTGKLCDGKNTCEVDIESYLTGICDCTQDKYLDVTYTCEDKKSARSKRSLLYQNDNESVVRNARIREQLTRQFGILGLGGLVNPNFGFILNQPRNFDEFGPLNQIPILPGQ